MVDHVVLFVGFGDLAPLQQDRIARRSEHEHTNTLEPAELDGPGPRLEVPKIPGVLAAQLQVLERVGNLPGRDAVVVFAEREQRADPTEWRAGCSRERTSDRAAQRRRHFLLGVL